MSKLASFVRFGLVAVAVALACLAPMANARAHGPLEADAPKPPRETAIATRLEQANTMLGSEIYDARGYLIGRLSQVLLGREFDRVALTLVASDKEPKIELAVPVTSLRRDAAARLAVDVIATDLSRVPKLDSGDWLALTNTGFLEAIDIFFKGHSDRYKEAAHMNVPPSLGSSEDTGMVKPKVTPYQQLTKLIGLAIRARDADATANLEDLVIDLVDGKVVYGVLSLNQPGQSEMLVAVPWTAVEVLPRQGRGNVDGTVATLAALAFSPANLPGMQDRAFASRVYQAFGRAPYWQVYGYAPREADHKAGWLVGSAFNRAFDFKEAQTFMGVVTSVGSFVPETGAVDGVRLRIRTATGEVLTVLVAPKKYTDKKGLRPRQGSAVTFTGCEAIFDGRPVIVASEVQTDGRAYQLRDGNGQPLWQPADIE